MIESQASLSGAMALAKTVPHKHHTVEYTIETNALLYIPKPDMSESESESNHAHMTNYVDSRFLG